MMMLIVIGEQRIVFVATRVNEGDQIENLLAGQFVEQSVRHDRHRRHPALLNLVFLDDRGNSFREWIDHDLDLGGRTVDGQLLDSVTNRLQLGCRPAGERCFRVVLWLA